MTFRIGSSEGKNVHFSSKIGPGWKKNTIVTSWNTLRTKPPGYNMHGSCFWVWYGCFTAKLNSTILGASFLEIGGQWARFLPLHTQKYQPQHAYERPTACQLTTNLPFVYTLRFASGIWANYTIEDKKLLPKMKKIAFFSPKITLRDHRTWTLNVHKIIISGGIKALFSHISIYITQILRCLDQNIIILLHMVRRVPDTQKLWNSCFELQGCHLSYSEKYVICVHFYF